MDGMLSKAIEKIVCERSIQLSNADKTCRVVEEAKIYWDADDGLSVEYWFPDGCHDETIDESLSALGKCVEGFFGGS